MPLSGEDFNTSAVRKLELSRLDTRAVQRGAMGTDVDVEHFSIYLSSILKTDLVGRLVDGSIDRTIEGASTLAVTISDDDRTLLNSGLLSSKLDVQLDGLWFRFASFDKNDDELDLVFEDREIAILREYSKWKIARRANVTRAEFVYSMIREVREFKIPVVIPELHVIQPIEKYSGDIVGVDAEINKVSGITVQSGTPVPAQATTNEEKRNNPAASGQTLTAKGGTLDQTQIQLANIILATVDSKLGNDPDKRKLMVCTIMTAIVESTIHNYPSGDADSVGLFQQRATWGTFEQRHDPVEATRLFLAAAVLENANNPNEQYWELCANVQHPREDLRQLYGKYRIEAERIVNAYGEVPNVNLANLMATQTTTGGSVGSNYSFWRGKIEDRHGNKIRKPENTWSCTQRLADDVDWRAFFVAGTFYFLSEEDLFKQKPVVVVSEFDEGIISMNGNYDRNKKAATITITAVIGKWAAPPGSVVVVRGQGPMNGRWLVNTFHRGLFDEVATITLKKPRPTLPEPLNDDSQDIQPTWYDQALPVDTGLAGKQLYQSVLNNKLITFTNASQKNDILTGQIDDRVLQFLLWMAANGKPCVISALKSDHSQYTTEGRLSAHGAGRAVDLENYNEANPGTNEIMMFIANGQVITGFDQLIGPNPLLVLPLGYYDQLTLSEHKSHVHVGWAI